MNNEPKTEIVKCTQCGGDSVHLEKREFPIDWNAGRTKEGVRGIIKSKIYDTHHIETRDEDEIIEIQYVKFPYKKEISDEQIEGMIESMN